MEEPGTGRASFWWSMLMQLLIFISSVIFVIETVEEIKKDKVMVGRMHVIEWICVIIFTIEYVIRLMVCTVRLLARKYFAVQLPTLVGVTCCASALNEHPCLVYVVLVLVGLAMVGTGTTIQGSWIHDILLHGDESRALYFKTAVSTVSPVPNHRHQPWRHAFHASHVLAANSIN